MEQNQTDLAKILSVSGYSGLYLYLAQARNGAIAEQLETKERTVFPVRSKITTLEDISIYTEDGELKLKEVFLKLKEVLKEKDAPDQKAAPEALKELFAQAVPGYDANRFYVSHMRKVVLWYNILKNHASLDFVVPEEAEKPAE